MKHGFTNGFDEPDDQRKRHYDVFEEVTLMAHHLQSQEVLAAIEEQVRFARRRFGRYEHSIPRQPLEAVTISWHACIPIA